MAWGSFPGEEHEGMDVLGAEISPLSSELSVGTVGVRRSQVRNPVLMSQGCPR